MEQYRLLTVAQVAERFDVGTVTVRNWCRAGLFPNALQGPRTGRGAVWLIPEGDLVDFEPPRVGRPPAGEGDPEENPA